MEVVGETGDRTMIRIMHWEIATVVRQIGAQEVEAPMLKLLAARHGCKVLHHDEKLLLNIFLKFSRGCIWIVACLVKRTEPIDELGSGNAR